MKYRILIEQDEDDIFEIFRRQQEQEICGSGKMQTLELFKEIDFTAQKRYRFFSRPANFQNPFMRTSMI
jgi:hypothetical protein